jgi:hypothetical protein
LSGIYFGRRVFLVANGPSIKEMNLKPLSKELICTVNMGLRAVGGQIPHCDFHVLSDKNRYLRFSKEIEGLLKKNPVKVRFLEWHSKKIYLNYRSQPQPIFFEVVRENILERGCPNDPFSGMSSCSTIVLLAAQLLIHMGFLEIYILGCDLNYAEKSAYFYQLTQLDSAHECDPKVVERRTLMTNSNQEFKILRAYAESKGVKLINVGVGGNLLALDRLSFESLF